MEKKMKIAIQLYGHLRTYQITAPYLIKHFVEPNRKIADVKIFIHTWDELDAVQNMPHYTKQKQYMGKKLSDKEIKKIYDLYNPVVLKIDSQVNLKPEDIIEVQKKGGDITLATALKNAFHSFIEVNKLRYQYEFENECDFDFVITTRPDILFFRGINFESIKAKVRGWQFYTTINDIIFSPYVVGYNDVVNQERYVSGLDLVMLGNSYTMNKFNSYDYAIDEMFPMWTEKAILYIMRKELVKHQFIVFEKDRCWTICRLNKQMRKKNAGLVSKVITWLYKAQIPLFLKSELFCRNTCLNVTTYQDKNGLRDYLKRMLE